MESLEIKKVIFHPTEIVFLRKKGNININVSDIDWISYKKPTIINYLLALFSGTYPNRLEIYLKKKINKTKLYLVRIKYNDVLKLQGFFQKEINTNLI